MYDYLRRTITFVRSSLGRSDVTDDTPDAESEGSFESGAPLSDMDCPRCDEPCLLFPVPVALREYAPEESSTAAICPSCLDTYPPVDGATSADSEGPTAFDAITESFPDGEAGAALALALGKLDSLALNRAAIETLLDHAARDGVDVLLALDRLAAAGTVQPHFDLDRRRVQVEQLLHSATPD